MPPPYDPYRFPATYPAASPAGNTSGPQPGYDPFHSNVPEGFDPATRQPLSGFDDQGRKLPGPPPRAPGGGMRGMSLDALYQAQQRLRGLESGAPSQAEQLRRYGQQYGQRMTTNIAGARGADPFQQRMALRANADAGDRGQLEAAALRHGEEYSARQAYENALLGRVGTEESLQNDLTRRYALDLGIYSHFQDAQQQSRFAQQQSSAQLAQGLQNRAIAMGQNGKKTSDTGSKAPVTADAAQATGPAEGGAIPKPPGTDRTADAAIATLGKSTRPYEYKAGVPGEKTGQLHYGPMAQAMASTPFLRSAVQPQPSGYLGVDTGRATMATMGLLGRLGERLAQLERGGAGRVG